MKGTITGDDVFMLLDFWGRIGEVQHTHYLDRNPGQMHVTYSTKGTPHTTSAHHHFFLVLAHFDGKSFTEVEQSTVEFVFL